MIDNRLATRIMCYEIRDKNPGAVRFVIDDYAVKCILEYTQQKRYKTLMCCFGYQFLLEMLNLFESHENYEECHEIKRQIEDFNKLIKEELPTRI